MHPRYDEGDVENFSDRDVAQLRLESPMEPPAEPLAVGRPKLSEMGAPGRIATTADYAGIRARGGSRLTVVVAPAPLSRHPGARG